MRSLIAVAGLLLTTGGAAATPAAPCSGQIHPNPGFEQGTSGWTAGPRIVVLADPARPAHTGRAYATFAGLDVTRTDLLRTSVAVPAGCTLTVGFWARVASTETTRGDYLNVGVSADGTPPKTVFSFAFDHPQQWTRHTSVVSGAAADRSALVTFYASEAAGGGATTFDVDDVTFTLS
ncbi:hypothetical protein [Actinoplanes sp. N902-109]|uniref:hypothetical protein n=1 Tax=Actinoplanes sp. (strain N902-109) TaxID=649831 RepID=UPI0003294FDA|nr:hypothetical protein [Actinoplanes sp. N902-109]AGL16882.1 hypothetical protein L083_3372 [Actinoplanes sp. N902-109]